MSTNTHTRSAYFSGVTLLTLSPRETRRADAFSLRVGGKDLPRPAARRRCVFRRVVTGHALQSSRSPPLQRHHLHASPTPYYSSTRKKSLANQRVQRALLKAFFTSESSAAPRDGHGIAATGHGLVQRAHVTVTVTRLSPPWLSNTVLQTCNSTNSSTNSATAVCHAAE